MPTSCKTFTSSLGAAALAVGLALGGAGGASAQTSTSILTGGTAGVFYILGAGMSEVINQNSDTISATAESTSATVENIRLINRNRGDFGFVINDALYYAYTGGREFEADGAYENLRTVMMGHLGIWQIAVRADSGIESFADLAGKRIAHLPGATGRLLVEIPLEANGLTEGDVTLLPLSLAEAVTAFKDGQVDAVSAAGGVPLSGLLDLSSSENVRFLALDDEARQSLVEAHPYFTLAEIRGGVYPGASEDVPTYALQYAIMTNQEQPDDVVGEFVRTLMANQEQFARVHPDAAAYTADNPAYKQEVLVPWHPGAEAALRELGAID
jgi:uncharacterized protein